MSRTAGHPFPTPPGGPGKTMHVPVRGSIILMRLFVMSLSMLFIASMVGYAAIRTGLFGSQSNTAARPAVGLVRDALPASLFLSTGLVLMASLAVSRALACVRRERQRPFRAWLAATLLIGVAFVIVQTPALASILSQQLNDWNAVRAAGGKPASAVLAAVFFLIIVHALHVVGGVISLSWVLYRAGQGAYDHEHHLPVRHTALYWHFLDVVWIVMFSLLWILG